MNNRGEWKISWQVLLLLVVIVLGTFLRFWQLDAGGLLHDETWVANFLLQTNVHYPRSSPILFLVILRGIMWVAGSGEFALRALPALAGSAGIPLLYVLARRFHFDRTTALICSILWAFAPLSLSFSRFCHHYTTEAVVVMVLFILVDDYLRTPRLWLFGSFLLLTLVSFGLTQTAILLVPTVALLLFLRWYQTRLYRDFILCVIYCVVAGAAFFSYYWFVILDLFPADQTTPTWQAYYLTLFPLGAFFLKLGGRLYGFFPLFFDWWSWWGALAMALFAIIGSVFLLLQHRLQYLVSILLPLLVVIVVALLHRYPFGERPDFYLLPLFILCIGYGISVFIRWNTPLAVVGCVGLLGVTFFSAFAQMPINARYRIPADVGSVLEYYMAHRLPDDPIAFIGRFQMPQYLYYGGNKDDILNCDGPVMMNIPEKIHCVARLATDRRVWWFWAPDERSGNPDKAGLHAASILINEDCHVLDIQQFTNAFLVLTDRCS